MRLLGGLFWGFFSVLELWFLVSLREFFFGVRVGALRRFFVVVVVCVFFF